MWFEVVGNIEVSFGQIGNDLQTWEGTGRRRKLCVCDFVSGGEGCCYVQESQYCYFERYITHLLPVWNFGLDGILVCKRG